MAVEGVVTVNGHLVESGSIAFFPVDDPQIASGGGVVRNGEFSISADGGPGPGRHRVEVRGMRKTGRQIEAGSPHPPGTLVDELVPVVPEEYNSESTMTVELKPGDNVVEIDFTVTEAE